MVRKLFKHEFKAYGLWVLLLYAAMPIAALVLKIVYCLTYEGNIIPDSSSESANIWIDMLRTASVIVYIGAVGVAFTLIYIIPLVRFYKNMLTSEGYLTLSIPVKPSQHISCKTWVAYIYQIGAVIAFAVSVFIIIIGEDAIEFFSVMTHFLDDVISRILSSHPLIILDVALLALAAIASPIASILHSYFCLSSGMLFGKHKLIGALLTYIIINVISSVVSGIAQLVLMPIFIFGSDPLLFITVFSVGTLLSVFGVIAIFYYATVYLFTHKVNL